MQTKEFYKLKKETHMKHILILALLLFLASCKQGQEQDQEQEQTELSDDLPYTENEMPINPEFDSLIFVESYLCLDEPDLIFTWNPRLANGLAYQGATIEYLEFGHDEKHPIICWVRLHHPISYYKAEER